MPVTPVPPSIQTCMPAICAWCWLSITLRPQSSPCMCTCAWTWTWPRSQYIAVVCSCSISPLELFLIAGSYYATVVLESWFEWNSYLQRRTDNLVPRLPQIVESLGTRLKNWHNTGNQEMDTQVSSLLKGWKVPGLTHDSPELWAFFPTDSCMNWKDGMTMRLLLHWSRNYACCIIVHLRCTVDHKLLYISLDPRDILITYTR